MGKLKPPNMAVPFVNGEFCDYEVIFDSMKDHGWALRKGQRDQSGRSVRADPENFDIPSHNTLIWVDQANMISAILPRIMPWQMVNHFPGMSLLLARKGRLCRNLTRLQRLCPKEFTFLPQTFVLPEDSEELRRFMGTSKRRTFIYKPDHQCQGRGIQLMQEWEHVAQSGALKSRESVVVQRYITNPLLLDGFKFDLRVYFLVTSLDPIQIYMFKDGLVRLSTQAYETPSSANLQKRCMHLTNYAVNKKAKEYEVGDDDGTGSKRHLSWFMDFIGKQHGEKARNLLWKRMKLLCVKMLLSVHPQLLLECESALPKDLAKTGRPRCFELLGIDVLVDEKLKPWLLEVNHLPSFATDSALDHDIKSRLVSQILDLLPVLPRGGRKLYEQLLKSNTEENREAFDAAWRREPTLIDFERAYPSDCEEVQERYDEVLRQAEEMWQSAYRGQFVRPMSKLNHAKDTCNETTASTASTADSTSNIGPPTRNAKRMPAGSSPKAKKARSPKRLVPRCAMWKPTPKEMMEEKLKRRADLRRHSSGDAPRLVLPMRQVALSFGPHGALPTNVEPHSEQHLYGPPTLR